MPVRVSSCLANSLTLGTENNYNIVTVFDVIISTNINVKLLFMMGVHYSFLPPLVLMTDNILRSQWPQTVVVKIRHFMIY